MEEKKKKVALYARCSTSHHDQNPEVQLHEMRRYCNTRQNWIIAEEIVDYGYSGSSATRPGLQRLNEIAFRREVDVIIVFKFDRLFRSLKHFVTTLDDYLFYGIQFISIRDNLDYGSPSGKFFIQVLGSLAELERSIIIERTLAGLDYAKSKGKVLGRPKTQKDEQIISMRKSGLSYRAIQDKLGISASVVTRVLKAHGNPLKNSTKKPSDSEGDFS